MRSETEVRRLIVRTRKSIQYWGSCIEITHPSKPEYKSIKQWREYVSLGQFVVNLLETFLNETEPLKKFDSSAQLDAFQRISDWYWEEDKREVHYLEDRIKQLFSERTTNLLDKWIEKDRYDKSDIRGILRHWREMVGEVYMEPARCSEDYRRKEGIQVMLCDLQFAIDQLSSFEQAVIDAYRWYPSIDAPCQPKRFSLTAIAEVLRRWRKLGFGEDWHRDGSIDKNLVDQTLNDVREKISDILNGYYLRPN